MCKNSMTRRAATLLLGGVALVAATATTISASSAQELKIIATGEPYGLGLKAAATAFEAKTGVKVTVDQFPYGDAYNKQVLLGTAGSDEYDMMVLDCIWLPIFVKNKWVQPFEPIEAKAKEKIEWNAFLPGIVDAYDVIDGQHWAAPIDFFLEVLAYRTDLFEAAGLKEPPKTWDEFRAYAEKLNDPGNNVYGVSTMPGEQDGGYSEWTVRLASLPMPPNSTQFVWDRDFNSMILHDDNGRKALDRWLEIKPFTAPGANEMGYAEATNAYMQGNAAMFVNWFGFFPDIENPDTSKVAGKVGYALPPVETIEGTRNDYIGGFQISIAANAPQPDLSYQFIAFVTSHEGQEIMLEAGASGAYRTDVYSNEKWLGKFPFLKPVKDAQNMIPLTSGLAEYVEMQRIIYDQLFAAWVGQVDSATAMKRASDGLDELMKSLGYKN
ncbi:ABC transporter substrate-binding protein [Shinella sp.]|jgi:ABC-type glycerol-3-phosphate transport system substrate-binding protein|uniref:ABC transporter substrate-binding protein n=1 Tax=Shinella sp. TaxID=1870904 RepID=UPI003F6F6FEC